MSESQSSAIGASVLRKEDHRFITGSGRFTDDINLPGQTYAVFVRSPLSHAQVKAVDTSEAESAGGVVAVLTGAQLAADELGGLPCGWMITSKDGSEMKQPLHPVMAVDKVNYVGEPVAIVIAETLLEARNAAEMVQVDYLELDAVIGVDNAQSAAEIHSEAPANTCYQWELGDQQATEAAFEGAAHITRLDLSNNRLIPNAIEPRAAIADYQPGTEELTLYTTSQNPHLARLILAAFIQIAPEHKLRVVSPDVGGGFGSKIMV